MEADYLAQVSARLKLHEARLSAKAAAPAALPDGPAWARLNGRWRLGWIERGGSFEPVESLSRDRRITLLEKITELGAAIEQGVHALHDRAKRAVEADVEKYGGVELDGAAMLATGGLVERFVFSYEAKP